jgi:RHS repeat-associated protein
MNLIDRVNRERSLTAISRTCRFGRIAANASVPRPIPMTPTATSRKQAVGAICGTTSTGCLRRATTTPRRRTPTTKAARACCRLPPPRPPTTPASSSPLRAPRTAARRGRPQPITFGWVIRSWRRSTKSSTTVRRPAPRFTRYVHPDHLGSTNVVTDASGTITQLFDYYPYGATRVSSTTYPTNEKRQYINQFMDAQTGLDYLNARYYDAARGQFLSQDQVFWEVGLSRDGVTALVNPQAMNSYAYAGGNPIIYKDSNGRFIQVIAAVCLAAIAAPYALMLYGAIAHSMDSVALGADLLGPAQGISAGAVEITGGSNPITGRSFESIAASTQAKENTSSSVYVGVDKCNAIKYVGRTNQDPEARWAQHKSTINSGRDALDYYTFGPPGSYTEKQSTLLEQSLIVKYGMQKNGGQLINRINSVSPSSPMYQFVKNYDGLWTGLPQTVTQNGTTYYRNSSGLLSNKPGQ